MCRRLIDYLSLTRINWKFYNAFNYAFHDSPFSFDSIPISFNLFQLFQDNNYEGLKKEIDSAETYLKDKSEGDITNLGLYYDVGTAYSNLNILIETNESLSSIIETDEYEKNIENSLKHYRVALHFFREGLASGFEKNRHIVDIHQKLLTNYGNALAKQARFPEALGFYYDVLKNNPAFDMARGCIGQVLKNYSTSIFPSAYSALLFLYSSNYLDDAIKSNHHEIIDSTRKSLIDVRSSIPDEMIEKISNEKESIFALKNRLDDNYRKWIHSHKLFLSYLQDIESIPLEYLRDDLVLPPIPEEYINGNDKQVYLQLFNQLKCTYLYARLLLFHSENGSKSNIFADSYLARTTENPLFYISVENLKASIGIAYSLFDKVASYINLFFDLKIEADRVDFNKIWTESDVLKNKRIENNGLLGLYWINRDFRYKFGSSLDPENKWIKTLRNDNEHKFLLVHKVAGEYQDFGGTVHNESIDDLENLSLAVLSLARESLILLVNAIYQDISARVDDYELYANMENDCPFLFE